MERIKSKHDDLHQKIRPGTTWVSGFTLPGNNDDLRSIDSEGSEMRFVPTSRYYASCKIKRGQAISIAQLEDLTDEQKQNKYAYVKITDPETENSCLGVAMNYAEEGQIVHVQSSGKFNYYTTESVLYNDERKNREIFLDANNWSFKEVRGQKLFVKKPLDENDNDWFTYDFVDSIYTTRNTIQIGYLTDAPTTPFSNFIKKENKWYQQISTSGADPEEITEVLVDKDVVIVEKDETGNVVTAEDITISSTGVTIRAGEKPPKAHEAVWVQKIKDKEAYVPVDDLTVTVELSITGDTRGPIDNTQFLVTLGESIYFETTTKDTTLEKPHYNEGVFDEVKVLALAKGEARGPSFNVFNAVRTTENRQCSFIALRKLDGDTYIIPILCSFTKDDLDGGLITDVNDEGYYKLSQQFTKGVQRTYIEDGQEVTRSPRITVADPVLDLNRDNLIAAISKGLQSIFVDDETNVVGCNIQTSNIGEDGFSISTTNKGGYYDIYFSTDLFGILSITQLEHGQSASEGTAMLADIRDENRAHIIGVVVSNTDGWHKKGEKVRVIRIGRLNTVGKLKPGETYFLGLNGRITAKQTYWYDECVPVGIAESSNALLVDTSQTALQAYGGNFPIGYMKPSIYGQAESGFALADGTTVYSKDQYPELYNLLLNWFTEDELKPSNVNEVNYDKYKIGTLTQVFEDLFTASMRAEELVKEANSILEDAKKGTNTVESDISAINSKISDLQTAFENYKTTVDTSLQTNNNELTTLKDLVNTNTQGISTIKEQITTVSTSQATLATKDTQQDTTLESYKARIESLEQDNTTLKSQIKELQNRINELENSTNT